MKLLKLKEKDNNYRNYYVITGLNFQIDEQLMTRTTRIVEFKKVLNVLDNPEDIFLMDSKFFLLANETLIWEIEFNKVDELTEKIPEEFL